jgi:hypothetical protein
VIPGWFFWQAGRAALALATSVGVGVKPGVVGMPDGATPPLGAVVVVFELVVAVVVLWVVVVVCVVGIATVGVVMTVNVPVVAVGTVAALVVEVVVAPPPPHPASARAASSAPIRSVFIAGLLPGFESGLRRV